MSRASASLLTNPVYASILGFSIIGWGLSFGPAFTVIVNMPSAAWLAIVVNGLFIITYGIIVGTGMLAHYRLALLAYSAASLSRVVGEASYLIKSESISYQIMAAGFLVQSLTLIFFIAAAGQGDGTEMQAVRTSSGSQVRYARAAAAIAAAELQQQHQHQQQSMGTPYSNMTPSAGASFAYPTQLPAMPLTQMPPHVAVPVLQQPPMSAVPTAPPASASTTPAATQASNANAENAGQNRPAPPPRISTMSTATISTRATTYAHRARAIYSYQASPDDPNEISFNKNEIVDIVDTAGKWWQAKKSNGMVGIVPSNYLELI